MLATFSAESKLSVALPSKFPNLMGRNSNSCRHIRMRSQKAPWQAYACACLEQVGKAGATKQRILIFVSSKSYRAYCTGGATTALTLLPSERMGGDSSAFTACPAPKASNNPGTHAGAPVSSHDMVRSAIVPAPVDCGPNPEKGPRGPRGISGWRRGEAVRVRLTLDRDPTCGRLRPSSAAPASRPTVQHRPQVPDSRKWRASNAIRTFHSEKLQLENRIRCKHRQQKWRRCRAGSRA